MVEDLMKKLDAKIIEKIDNCNSLLDGISSYSNKEIEKLTNYRHMEKILGFDLEKIIRGNNIEDITCMDRSSESDRIYLRNLYVAENDGEVLYENEKVSYNKGDLLISFEYYGCDNEGKSNTVRKVVNTRITDIAEVIKEFIKK